MLFRPYLILLLALVVGAAAQTPEHPGAAIYRKQCASCHGDKGQGVKEEYDEPLHGNRSVAALAKRIARTMPEDDVGACVGENAEQVAAYIYDAFYSPKAQWRLKPPEWELSRLTIAQYRTSVADLLGQFKGFEKPLSTERGLKAHYSGRRVPVFGPQLPPDKDENAQRRKERAQYDQVDAQVAFTFGTESPDPQRLQASEFRLRWEGAVMAPETGVYEFVVRSENGVRLWVNDLRQEIIDAWVSTGTTVRDEKKSVYLLGGRAYPLMLEFFKFNDKSASVQLLWKPPHGVLEVIPKECLAPDRPRETVVAKSTFPPDDRSVGYERGSSISKEWDAATTDAALDLAEYVDGHLDELAGTKSGAPDRVEKLKGFCRRFLEGAFRRPLAVEDAQRLVERSFASAKTPELAVKRVVLLGLKSPRFLYPELPDNEVPDGYDVATRLALAMWDSLPDQKLLEAAAQNKLRTREQIAGQVARMMPNPRTRAKLHGFFHHWLELERAEAIAKDAQAFPGFDAAVLADLRTSLNLFLDEVVWSDASDYRELLRAPYLYLNERLGAMYGHPVQGAGFQRVAFDPNQRTGVVTHPYLLAAFAYSKQTSPIHRGVFLTRTIIGMTLKPPPNAVAFEDAKFEAHLTMREKITELTKNANCMGCHATINPLGFTLENYDAIGRWRTKDGDKPINPVSDFAADDGSTVHLTGPADLVKFAAESSSGHRAFIHHLFHHTAKQAVEVYGPDALEDLRQGFVATGFNMRKLLTEMVIMDAMRGMPETQPPKVAAAKLP